LIAEQTRKRWPDNETAIVIAKFSGQTNKEKLAQMENCKRWLDEVRHVFGDPVRIVAREAGHVVEWSKTK
jgi:hypothetical protein